MSIVSVSSERVRPAASHIHDRALGLGRVVFGDRLGVTIFLGAVCFFFVYWRIGVFITDTYTVANTLVGVADGHLFVDHIVYGPGPDTPGMHLVDGKLYGRNYGEVALALPFLWALDGVTAVADLRVALAGLFGLLVLALCVQVGRLDGHRRTFTVLGSVCALVTFAANVAFAHPIASRWLPLIALQSSTMVAAGLVGVVVYRLLARVHGRRVGAVAGVLTVLATPVGFWASIPKRHALTTLLAVCTFYCLYRSRAGTTREHALGFRGLAYVFVGLTTWVHAPEALVLFLALVVSDLPTARSNDLRTLTAIGVAFALSMVPFFVTNLLIAGNPVEPPRLLPSYGGGFVSTPSQPSSAGGVFSPAITAVTTFGSLFTDGITVAIEHPERLSETFLRSGYIQAVAANDGGAAINLAVLESAPVLGALFALPVFVAAHWPDWTASKDWLRSPAGATDVLACVYPLGLTLVYLPRLPNNAQVTVRYLLALFPVLVYVAVRLPAIRRSIARTRTFAWSFVATSLVGGQLLVVALAVSTPTLGETVQLHAWIGLAAALALGGWSVVATMVARSGDRLGAVCLGVAAGAGTVFVVLSGTVYFSYAGAFALPISRLVSEALAGVVG